MGEITKPKSLTLIELPPPNKVCGSVFSCATNYMPVVVNKMRLTKQPNLIFIDLKF
jgi:hypothetical protein